MVKKMLIDASHLEEMRVVVVDGTRLDELDIETSTKKQLKGNIYLAKVARVEPSLQAAFVDYGGNRHGFLAFNEIHPDYYQIPVADREALKEALLREVEDEEDDDEEKAPRESGRRSRRRPHPQKKNEDVSIETPQEDADEKDEAAHEQQEAMPEKAAAAPEITEEVDDDDDDADHIVETVSENDPDEVMPRTRPHQIKRYKIQEVIHRGQVLLVQITKEERGNKGAALTTYLSLAGRYCVLMPNNARGGGVSRKITNAADRKRLKTIINELPLPTGMSVIVRTAGKERTKLEIKRDYEYLIKTWVQIRDKTMISSAPSLIHEEGNLIKRALRDMYTRDISEVLIEGEQEYKMAKDFMKILTPSHAKKVKQYKDEPTPLFFKYQVESQLESMHSNIVQLKSGAYLVMDQTEALVAIDVNSGRATKERNIEETALKTNLEAADEIARQLRLRDMAGLVVIDFIDMEEPRNNHAVERRMKEALKRDRARVQMGRITGFGLMELSRQRLHSSFLETSYITCPHCRGKGLMRSTESAAIHVLHILEEEGIKRRFGEVLLTVPTSVALYVLNQKRDDLAQIEGQYKMKIRIEGDDVLVHPTDFRIERVARTEGLPETNSESTSEETPEEARRQQNRKPEEKQEKDRNRDRRPRKGKDNSRRNTAAQREDAVEASDSWVVTEDIIAVEDPEDIIQADVLFEEGLKASSRLPEKSEKKDERRSDEERPSRSRYLRRDRRFGRRRPRPEGDDFEEKTSEIVEAAPMEISADGDAEQAEVKELKKNTKQPKAPAKKKTKLVEKPEEIQEVAEAVEKTDEEEGKRRHPSHRRRMRPHTRPRPEGTAEGGEITAASEKPKAVAAKESDKPIILYNSHASENKKPKKAETAKAMKSVSQESVSAKPEEEKRKGWWQRLVK